jgi:shikimate kinase
MPQFHAVSVLKMEAFLSSEALQKHVVGLHDDFCHTLYFGYVLCSNIKHKSLKKRVWENFVTRIKRMEVQSGWK